MHSVSHYQPAISVMLPAVLILALLVAASLCLLVMSLREEPKMRISALSVTPPRTGPGLLSGRRSDVEIEEQEDLEGERLHSWRYMMLVHGLDFPPDDALKLLNNRNLDWHEAERLVNSGCPPHLVVKILED